MAAIGGLTTVWAWFNATFAQSSAKSCLIYYDRERNTVFLLNDAGTNWQSGGLGSVGALENSQCALSLSASDVSIANTILTLNLALTFKTAFAGPKNIYLYAASKSGGNSGWWDRGDWTVPAAPVVAVTADAASPASGSGARSAFALTYANTQGAGGLTSTWVWFSSSLSTSSAGSCLAYYTPANFTVHLINDAGNGWTSALLGTAPSSTTAPA